LLYSYVSEGITGFSDAIAAGRRALTLHVDEVSSINGLVRPGDRLDLLVTSRGGPAPAARPLMWGVKVLATGSLTDDGAGEARRATDGARRYSTITLEVTPEEAEQVILAREAGQVTAMLRRRTGDPDDGMRLPPRAAPPAAAPAPGGVTGPSRHADVLPARSVDYILGGRRDGVPEYLRVPLDLAAHVAAGRAPPRPQPAAATPDAPVLHEPGALPVGPPPAAPPPAGPNAPFAAPPAAAPSIDAGAPH
jgi:pilus assembly protein CpaB